MAAPRFNRFSQEAGSLLSTPATRHGLSSQRRGAGPGSGPYTSVHARMLSDLDGDRPQPMAAAARAAPSTDGLLGITEAKYSHEEWLSAFFTLLVTHGKREWLSLQEAVSFLTLGAMDAVNLIYASVGAVGPPVTPEPGSLFIVDERRLDLWRADGYKYDKRSGGTVSISFKVPLEALADPQASLQRFAGTGTAGTSSAAGAELIEQTVVLEWARLVRGDPSQDRYPFLQRRAVRLPRASQGLEGVLPPGAGWIWLVQYQVDPNGPRYNGIGTPTPLEGGGVPPSVPGAGQAILSPMRGANTSGSGYRYGGSDDDDEGGAGESNNSSRLSRSFAARPSPPAPMPRSPPPALPSAAQAPAPAPAAAATAAGGSSIPDVDEIVAALAETEADAAGLSRRLARVMTFFDAQDRESESEEEGGGAQVARRDGVDSYLAAAPAPAPVVTSSSGGGSLAAPTAAAAPAPALSSATSSSASITGSPLRLRLNDAVYLDLPPPPPPPARMRSPYAAPVVPPAASVSGAASPVGKRNATASAPAPAPAAAPAPPRASRLDLPPGERTSLPVRLSLPAVTTSTQLPLPPTTEPLEESGAASTQSPLLGPSSTSAAAGAAVALLSLSPSRPYELAPGNTVPAPPPEVPPGPALPATAAAAARLLGLGEAPAAPAGGAASAAAAAREAAPAPSPPPSASPPAVAAASSSLLHETTSSAGAAVPLADAHRAHAERRRSLLARPSLTDLAAAAPEGEDIAPPAVAAAPPSSSLGVARRLSLGPSTASAPAAPAPVSLPAPPSPAPPSPPQPPAGLQERPLPLPFAPASEDVLGGAIKALLPSPVALPGPRAVPPPLPAPPSAAAAAEEEEGDVSEEAPLPATSAHLPPAATLAPVPAPPAPAALPVTAAVPPPAAAAAPAVAATTGGGIVLPPAMLAALAPMLATLMPGLALPAQLPLGAGLPALLPPAPAPAPAPAGKDPEALVAALAGLLDRLQQKEEKSKEARRSSKGRSGRHSSRRASVATSVATGASSPSAGSSPSPPRHHSHKSKRTSTGGAEAAAAVGPPVEATAPAPAAAPAPAPDSRTEALLAQLQSHVARLEADAARRASEDARTARERDQAAMVSATVAAIQTAMEPLVKAQQRAARAEREERERQARALAEAEAAAKERARIERRAAKEAARAAVAKLQQSQIAAQQPAAPATVTASFVGADGRVSLVAVPAAAAPPVVPPAPAAAAAPASAAAAAALEHQATLSRYQAARASRGARASLGASSAAALTASALGVPPTTAAAAAAMPGVYGGLGAGAFGALPPGYGGYGVYPPAPQQLYGSALFPAAPAMPQPPLAAPPAPVPAPQQQYQQPPSMASVYGPRANWSPPPTQLSTPPGLAMGQLRGGGSSAASAPGSDGEEEEAVVAAAARAAPAAGSSPSRTRRGAGLRSHMIYGPYGAAGGYNDDEEEEEQQEEDNEDGEGRLDAPPPGRRGGAPPAASSSPVRPIRPAKPATVGSPRATLDARKYAPFVAADVRDALASALAGWRVRAALQTRRVAGCLQRLRDTRAMYDDLVARGEAHEPNGAETTLAASLAAQVRNESGELCRLLTPPPPPHGASAAATSWIPAVADIVAHLKSKGKVNPRHTLGGGAGRRKTGATGGGGGAAGGVGTKSRASSIGSLSAEEDGALIDASEVAPEPGSYEDELRKAKAAKAAAARASRLKGGALGRAVMERYSKVNAAPAPAAAAEGSEGTTEAAPAPAAEAPAPAPPLKPWLVARRSAAAASAATAAGDGDVVVVAAPPGARKGGASASVASASWAGELPPSSRWRLLVEAVAGRNLAPAVVPPGAVAAGPGMVGGSTTGPVELAPPSPEARTTFVNVYVARPAPAAKAGGPTHRVLGKKLPTPSCPSTLNPEYPSKLITIPLPLRPLKTDADDAASPPPPTEWPGWEFRAEILDTDRYALYPAMGEARLPLADVTTVVSADAARTLAAPKVVWCKLTPAAPNDRVRGEVGLRVALIAPDPALHEAALAEEAAAGGEAAAAASSAAASQQQHAERLPFAVSSAAGGRRGATASPEREPVDAGAGGSSASFLKRRSQAVRPAAKRDWSSVAAKTVSRVDDYLLRPGISGSGGAGGGSKSGAAAGAGAGGRGSSSSSSGRPGKAPGGNVTTTTTTVAALAQAAAAAGTAGRPYRGGDADQLQPTGPFGPRFDWSLLPPEYAAVLAAMADSGRAGGGGSSSSGGWPSAAPSVNAAAAAATMTRQRQPSPPGARPRRPISPYRRAAASPPGAALPQYTYGDVSVEDYFESIATTRATGY